MKESILLFILIPLCFSFTLAQDGNVQQQINEDVWKPFMKAYSEWDVEAFMAVHTEDLIRIVRDGEDLFQKEEYTKRAERGSQWGKENNVTRSIEFSFLERFAKNDLAYEVGYYKGRSQKAGEEERIYYGKFHVILKKVDEKWKLFIDADTSDNGRITEEVFRKGEGLE